MKKIISLVLAIIFTFSLFACGSGDNNIPKSDASKSVLSYKELSISEGVFSYELAFQKANFLYNYFGTMNEDVPELWEEVTEDGIFGDTFIEMVLDNSKKMLYYANYAIEQGEKLTDDDLLLIENGHESLISRFGSEEVYEEFLNQYGVTSEEVYEYSKLGVLYEKGYELMFGYDAPEMITEEEIYEYYNENFITTKHIYLDSYYKLSDDNETYTATTEEERADIAKRMDDIEALARAEGADFEALIEEYNEDENAQTWSNGFTFTDGTFGLAEYENQTLHGGIEVGELKRFEVEGFGIFLVKRLELSEDMYSYFAASIENMLIDDKADAAIAKVDKDFVIDEEKLSGYSMSQVVMLDLERYYGMSEDAE